LIHIEHGIVQSAAHQELEGQIYTSQPCSRRSSDAPTVYTFLVAKGLCLLCLIPVEDQAVAEGERSSGIGGGFIAVVEGTRKGRLDMTDSLSLEVVGSTKVLGHLQRISKGTIAWGEAIALTCFLHASRWGSGMLASTVLISPGPKPVTVLLCFGRVKLAGPTGPCKSEMGALVEGRLSRGGLAVFVVAIFGCQSQ
jgi:hypothetical protein